MVFQDRKILDGIDRLAHKIEDLTTKSSKDKENLLTQLEDHRKLVANLSDDFVELKHDIKNVFETQEEILNVVKELTSIFKEGHKTEIALDLAETISGVAKTLEQPSENDLRRSQVEKDNEEDEAPSLGECVPEEQPIQPEAEETSCEEDSDEEDDESDEAEEESTEADDSSEDDEDDSDDDDSDEEDSDEEDDESDEAEEDHPSEELYLDSYLEGLEEVIPSILKNKTLADFSIFMEAMQQTNLSNLSDLVERYDNGSSTVRTIHDILRHSDYKSTVAELATNLKRHYQAEAPEFSYDQVPEDITNGIKALILAGGSLVNGMKVDKDTVKDLYKLSNEILAILFEG